MIGNTVTVIYQPTFVKCKKQNVKSQENQIEFHPYSHVQTKTNNQSKQATSATIIFSIISYRKGKAIQLSNI